MKATKEHDELKGGTSLSETGAVAHRGQIKTKDYP